MTDLKQAYEALQAKTANYDKLFRYYDGNQPLMYTAKRLEEVFRGLDSYMVENWCAVVVDAAKERINLTGATVPAAQQTAVDDLLKENQLLLEADDVHLAALVAGEAFYIAWPDDSGRGQGYYNDPRLCHVFYDPENPRRKQFAAKWWTGADEKGHITLYYPDRLEYYISRGKASAVSSVSAFQPDEGKAPGGVAENTYGVVPVWHFRLTHRKVKSEIDNVIAPQNGINKLLTDMLVAAEYGAFRQRWIISNSDTDKLKNAPNEIWNLPAGDGVGQQTSVGEFSATELANYFHAVDNLAGALSSITRTPRHYFFSTGGDPSGEALIAMEAPLTKKVQDYIDRFTPVWQEVISFLMQINGVTLPPKDIVLKWSDPETVQPRTQAEIQQMRVGSGEPLVTVKRDMGASEAELAQLETDLKAQRAAQTASLAQALVDNQRAFDRGQQDQEEL